ncbi:MAG: AmmeMemoRadiSam system radical SAM enzyme, partial [Gammaproteobacteria bacterium]|nr:AmmeMemoRadiSam system radical SAM enzyme [Gammaproteobacteria bacterium]
EADVLNKTASPKDIAKTAKAYGCKSVAFTYNEPTIFMEYAIDVAKECHKLGLKTIAVTNGYICEKPREEFFSYMDAANVDLKGFSEKFYKDITGSHLQPVLDTLIYLKQHTKVWFEITTLLIPGENDSALEIDAKTKWIKQNLGVDVPLHFSAFYPTWKMLDKPMTPLETLVNARNIAIKNGLRYVYTGNTYYPEGGKTFCYNCKKCVILRSGYEISEYHLDHDGNCEFCHTKCDGVFE